MSARRLSCLLLSVLAFFCLAFSPPVLVNGDLPQRTLSPQQIRGMRQVPPPELSAASSLLVNTTTRRVLYARNENERRAVGSLVKMVTALVALQQSPLDKELRVRNEDLAVGSSANLQNGELLTLHEFLFFLLVPSDNAASMTIARTLGRDVPTFVGWMNELVAQWGLLDTHFANPSGLDNRNAYSSAHDMALIALRAMANPVFADIARRPEIAVAARRLPSTNELLNSYPGMIGVKTGTTDQAGECFVALVDRPQGKTLAVVLGSEDRFRDARLLMDYCYANYAEVRIDLPQTAQNRYQDEAGNWREFQIKEPAVFLVNPWQVQTVSLYRRIDVLAANPVPQEPIGALMVSLGGRPLSEIPLYVR